MRPISRPVSIYRLFFALVLGGAFGLASSPAGPSAAAAQEVEGYQIQGVVVEEDVGQPLAGVEVGIRGTSITTITNPEGRFTLDAPLAPGTYDVQFSFIGYSAATREVTLADQRVVSLDTISLVPSPVVLDELIATGTGVITQRRAVGNTVETVGGEDVSEAPGAATIDQALQGKVTGAVISENSGQPGGGVSIRLRGTSSILGGAEPLIVVDGVIIDNSSEALVALGSNVTRGGSALTNRLADIAPGDIERIEVVKGAAAAALYGSRANNGVIQIFTRRGAQGAPRVSFSSEISTERTPKTYDLNMAPRAGIADVAFAGADSVGAPVQRFDIQDRLFRRGYGTTNQLSLSGGSEATTYYLSGGYRNEEGILETTGYERLNARARINQVVAERIDVGASLSVVQSEADFVPEGEQTQGVLTTVIFTPTSFDPTFDENLGRYPYNPVLNVNPFVVLEQWEAAEDVLHFTGQATADWRPIDDLTLSYLFGLDDYRQENTYLRTPFSESPSFGGSIQNPLRLSRQMNHDLTLNYRRPLSDVLESETTVGTRYTSDRTNTIFASAGDLPPGQTLVGGATPSASQSVLEFRTFGAFAQERLSFRDRLYLTGALNLEGSTAFGEDERWQLFPKLQASYVVSDEQFFTESALSRVFSSLRLRAAYGETGGQPPGLYSRFDNYVDVNYAGRPGLVASSLAGNPDLKPERQREIEGGFDAGFLRDRVDLEFSYYDKFTSDLVLSVPLPPSRGRQAQFQNIGELSNTGVEVSLNTLNLNTPDFSWRSRLSFAHNENRVERLVTAADTVVTGYLNAVVEGEPVGVFYGGIYARDAEGNVRHDEAGLPIRGQDTIMVNGETEVVNAARIIGDPNPDFTLGFRNTFTVRDNLQFDVLLDGRFGNDVANFTRRITEFFGVDEKVEREISGDTVPRTYALNPNGRIQIYEEYIEDGSFVKLREIALRYTLPSELAGRLGAGSASIRIAGRNLYTWTDYSGLDPEVNLFSANTVARGVDFATTPLPRAFVAGINLTY